MLEWIKSPVSLIRTFDAVLPARAGVERREMFGYPAAFVGGNMAAGLFQEHLILRLPDARRSVLLAEPGSTPFEPMPGRAMKEYVVVSPAIISDRRELQRWIGEALSYASSLPPKAKAKARPAKKIAAKPVRRAAKVKKGQAVKKAAKVKKPAKKTAKRGR